MRILMTLLACSVFATGCATSHVKKSAFSGMLDNGGRGKSRAKNEVYRAVEDDEGSVSSSEVESLRKTTANWRWPLTSVQITSGFGSRNGNDHEGVDMKAQTGTPVYASSSGKVLYSGSKLAGYGKLIVLKHESGLSTVYAHNSNLMVRPGTWVKQGQQIALSGNTGRTSGPHLHFEIRRGVRAIDPRELIATSQAAIPADQKPSRTFAAVPRTQSSKKAVSRTSHRRHQVGSKKRQNTRAVTLKKKDGQKHGLSG